MDTTDARNTARRIDELLLNATAPRVQLLFDGWLLRTARNDVKRASSINIVGSSAMPLEEKISYCENLYRGLGLEPIFRLTEDADAASLDAALADRGYAVLEPSVMETCLLEAVPSVALDGFLARTLPMHEWVPTAGALRGRTPEQIAAERDRLESSPLWQHGLIAYAGGTEVGCGLAIAEGSWAGLFDVFVVPAHRSQGLATWMAAELLRHAHRRGAERGWLSVVAENAPARSVYARLGFEPVSHYWYRVPAS